MTVEQWSSKNGRPSGSRARWQRNLYAYRVMVAVSGDAACPSCGISWAPGDSEVDRAVPARGYVPGNICYLCRNCNQERSRLQTVGSDWCRIADYIADVLAASATVEVPTEREASDWWQSVRDGDDHGGKYC